MIAKILPTVNPSPAPRRVQNSSDDACFSKALEEKQQPKAESMPAPLAEEKAVPENNEDKTRGEKESESSGEVQPAVSTQALPQVPTAVLAEGSAPKMEDMPSALVENIGHDDKQLRLQKLVMQAADGNALTATDTAANDAVQESGSGWPLFRLSTLGAASRGNTASDDTPVRSLAVSPVSDDKFAAAEGEQKVAPLRESEASVAGEKLPVAVKAQVQEKAPLIQSGESRFSVLPEENMRPAISVVHQRDVVPAPQLTPLPGNTLSAPVGTPAWQQALSHQLSWFTRNGVHNAELRLHPEELGSLQINLRLNNDRAQLHFVTENHQVRAALESAMPHLRTSLAESGIELGHSSVGHESPSSWQESFPSGDSDGRGSDSGETVENLTPDTDIATVAIENHTMSNGINTFI